MKPGCIFVKREQITKSNLLTNFQVYGLEILKKKKKVWRGVALPKERRGNRPVIRTFHAGGIWQRGRESNR